jgi:hypothetical protein
MFFDSFYVGCGGSIAQRIDGHVDEHRLPTRLIMPGLGGRFLHFCEIPEGALTEAIAVEFTQPSHRDDPQGDNVPRGFCYAI